MVFPAAFLLDERGLAMKKNEPLTDQKENNRGSKPMLQIQLSRRDFLSQTGKLGLTALAAPAMARAELGIDGAQGEAVATVSEPAEFAAGELVLPFAYSLTPSSAAQPEGLNFSRQPGPDNCQVFIRIDGELWEFRSQWIIGLGSVARYSGPDIDRLVKREDGTYPDGMTACWFLGGMWYDESDRKLYAPMHIEQDGHRRLYANCRKIALGTSTDKGRTWRYEGDIVTSETYYYPHDYFKFSGSAFGNGVADFGFYVDVRGGYFYIFPDEGWSYKVDARGGMCWNSRAARCAIRDRMAPGKWKYFYNGNWDEPALGGKSSTVSPGHLWGVTYSKLLDKYICLFPGNEDPPSPETIDGVYIGCCSDLAKQDWVWGHCPEAMFGFLNLISPDGSDVALECENTFRYYAYFGPGDFRRIDVKLAKGQTRTSNLGCRYLFEPHPESSDPILGRSTRIVGATQSDVTYSGSWNLRSNADAYEKKIKESSAQGDSIEFSFSGDAVYWRALRSPGSGKADVYLDGALRKTVDCYSPRSTTCKEFLYFHRSLTAGQQHTIKIVVRGDKHPNSGGLSIGHVAFEYAAESYQASAGFSSLMGKNNWFYQQRNGVGYVDLKYPADEFNPSVYWSGSGACRIGLDYQVPGEEASARRWLAPHGGTVRIEGTVTSEKSNFLASIWLNERKLWPEEHTVSQGPSSHDLNVEVMEDAFLTFLVSQKAPSRTADSCTPGEVSWNPVITYLPGGNSPAVWRPNPAGAHNLALNKYGRSKALVSSYRPFDAVDGDLTTAFAIHADDPISSGEDWFAVDLDKTCLIDRYVLICQSQNPLYLPKRFSVQRSDDGLVWSDVEVEREAHRRALDGRLHSVDSSATRCPCLPRALCSDLFPGRKAICH